MPSPTANWNGDFVAVVRFQGPASNGMPELHKLTPPLGVLQDRGFKVALVTDGRMSGASGKVPAAIHLTPEALHGGPVARVETGDLIRIDAVNGTLEVLVDDAEFAHRTAATIDLSHYPRRSGPGAIWRVPAKCGRCRAGRQHIWSCGMNIDEIMRISPVIPVMIIGRAGSCGAAGARTGEGVACGYWKSRYAPTPPSMRCGRAIMAEVDGAIVGAGTVLTYHQLDQVYDMGCAFAVSPGFTDGLLDAAATTPIPLLPGASSASEVMTLLERGYTRQKFFPAGPAGGVPFLKSLASPLPDAQFCPTGGISASNAKHYLELSNVLCVGGSWVAPPEAVEEGAWDQIEALARAAAQLR